VSAAPIGSLQGWQEFYEVIGAAAAALLGAMFVVASIGSGFLTQNRSAEVRLFLTPTVVQLSTVLFGCALALVPSPGWKPLAALFGLGGTAGFIYSLVIGTNIRRRELELSDRLWYAGAPIVAYALIMAAASMAWNRAAGSLEMLAGGMALLLAAGIRNAWDGLIFLVSQARGPTAPSGENRS
jgi:hypothetical protein